MKGAKASYRTLDFWSGLKKFFVHVLGQVRTYNRIYPGIMHALIFWGTTMLIFGHVVSLMQMQLFIPFIELPFPRGNVYLAFELAGDLAGLILIAGLLMAAFRRLVLRPKYLTSKWDDYYALIILCMIAVMGYINEGVRISASAPAWANWSPVGNLVAGWMLSLWSADQLANIHSTLIPLHMASGLLFAASIPFTKLRHLIYVPLNILLKPDSKEGTLEAIEDIENTELLGVGKIEEFSGLQLLSFDACVQCGRCEDLCPVAESGINYSPKDFIQNLRTTTQSEMISSYGDHPLQDIFVNNQAWACTTCGLCLNNCPAFVDTLTPVIDLRRYQVLTEGKMPKSVGATLRNMERQGNPWGFPHQERLNWAEGLDLPLIQPGKPVDVLLFLGCSLAFDERNKKIARAILQLFERHQVDYAILGLDEGCCGETARRLGHEYIFQVMAQNNIEMLSNLSFDRVVTQCPHCMNTIKDEYPQFGGNFEVQHITQFLKSLEIEAASEYSSAHQRITYHDPCYLGRYQAEYEAPRVLLQNSRKNLIELQRGRKDSFCCGGGGGQMWLETESETRINNQRLDQILNVGADIVATACPYCMTMLEEAVTFKGLGKEIQIKDICEILIDDSIGVR